MLKLESGSIADTDVSLNIVAFFHIFEEQYISSLKLAYFPQFLYLFNFFFVRVESKLALK